jgi:hypothetical protein
VQVGDAEFKRLLHADRGFWNLGIDDSVSQNCLLFIFGKEYYQALSHMMPSYAPDGRIRSILF